MANLEDLRENKICHCTFLTLVDAFFYYYYFSVYKSLLAQYKYEKGNHVKCFSLAQLSKWLCHEMILCNQADRINTA